MSPDIRVLDSRGELAALVDAPQAARVRASGAFRPVHRKRRLRALVPIAGRELTAESVIADLNAVSYDVGPTIRPGFSHRFETNDNPRGVLTISRIPASVREIFTAVVDECSMAA